MEVLIIGGGAAGLMAGARAAELGASVTVIERNEKTGKKLYITGKGRCNLTCNLESREFLLGVVRGGKFLTSAVTKFPPQKLIEFFENLGVPLKTERGNRVFPVSEKASDISRALTNRAQSLGVKFIFNERVVSVIKTENGFNVVTETEINRETKVLSRENARLNYRFDKVIVATGGKSYPKTGSTGDGYALLNSFGHTIIEPRPSLVSILFKNAAPELTGLSLVNVECSVVEKNSGKKLFSEFGEMLFTLSGVSGPAILRLSALLADKNMDNLELRIDLKPALSLEQLDRRILRDIDEFKNRQLKNSLFELLPKSLIPYVIERSAIDPEKRMNSLTRGERQTLLSLLKGLSFEIASLGGFDEAVVTAGGADTAEFNPKTMESKLVSGLYAAGEVLNIDGFTGGYNLQIAFSTAYAAGEAAAIASE